MDHGIASEASGRRAGGGVRLAVVPTGASLIPRLPTPEERRISRKMSLIRRSGLFGSDTKGARIFRAATLEDLRAAYKLVHRVYLGTGFISEEQAAMRLRIFETSPNTATFVAKKDGCVVGVLTIVHDTEEFGLPSDDAFKDELRHLRAKGRKIGEITNQAVDEAYRSSAVPTELMRCALAHGIESGFDFGVAAVSPSHLGFYELLGFEKVGSERSYSGKIHDPVIPLQINLASHRDDVRAEDPVQRFIHNFLTAENPYRLYVDAWEKVAQERFRDPGLLQSLFQGERDFLGECSEDQLRRLQAHWGRELFLAVTGSRFAALLPSDVPDLAELTAPHEGQFCLARVESESALVREVEFEAARGRCVDELGLPKAVVDRVMSPHEAAHPSLTVERPRSLLRPLTAFVRKPLFDGRPLRAFLNAVWRHTVRTPERSTA